MNTRKLTKMLLPGFDRITALLLLAVPVIVQAQFTFTTNNGAITITGYNGTGDDAEIPDTTNGYPVTGIGDYAFAYSVGVTSISIPESVTTIGQDVFLGCAGLTNISVDPANPSYSSLYGVLFDSAQDTLIAYPAGIPVSYYLFPGSCTSIDTEAFAYSFNLTTIFIPDTVNNIGADAFDQSGLISVTISGSVTNIGGSAFAFCANLTSANFLGDAPPDVGTAFYGDPEAVVYYLPETTGWGALFGNAPTLATTPGFEFVYEVNPDDSITITDYIGADGTVVIPGGIDGYLVTSIGPRVFWGDSLTNVIIPGSVASIGTGAFTECDGLTTVTINNGVASIGIAAFQDCENLTGITIPNSVASIGEFAFDGCGLTNITIPDNVTNIGFKAFAYCYSLASVTIDNGVPGIGEDAFYDCTSLTSVTIPDSVAKIGTGAFQQCFSLTSVAIPASVTSIGVNAFLECTSLTNFTVDTANPSYSSSNGVLFDEAQDTLIAYPAGSTDGAYTVPGGVTNIAYGAFGFSTSLTTIVLPGSCASIAPIAFYDCAALASVTIPNSVTSIGDEAFDLCTSLTSAYFQGNAPPDDGTVFTGDPATIVYYLPGTTGWGATFGSAPTELWNPQATNLITSGNAFSFSITGPTNLAIEVEACTNLANPVWVPVSTNTLSASGTSSFSDPQWVNFPMRFYRFSAP